MTATQTTVSRKLIAEWSGDVQVGIWDNESWSIRLYADRAIVKTPYVKWINNSGSLDYRTSRLTGSSLAKLIEIAQQQIDDNADYTDRAKEIAWDEMHST